MGLTPWLVVAGDFSPLGGMDMANYALARYLAGQGEVHLVTHRVWPDLDERPCVTVHRVPRPFGSHALGGLLLSRAGARVWRALQTRGGVHAVVNGGNCDVGAVNWVHYVHASYVPETAGSVARRVKTTLVHRRELANERRAVGRARVVVCNSRRTRDEVIARLGVEPSRAHVVYYGTDAARFSLVHADERERAKRALGCAAERPLVGFVGALGDRRKAFDTVFAAWTELCRQSDWDADLIVAGAGAERLQWQQRAREAGLDRRMRFLGFRTDIPAVFAALDALVHPARYEAYGLSVQEAICRGVPAFVSASAGVAEQYPEELRDLLIADPNNGAELAARLRGWRCRVDDWRSRVAPLSTALRARTWDAMAADIAVLAAGAGAA